MATTERHWQGARGAPRVELWLERVASVPVVAVAGLVVLGLLMVANAYGFHRDELYFIVAGRHPAFGYVDQPPLTPLLSAGAVQLLGLSPLAIRLLPALATGACVVLAAEMAAAMGGGRRSQLIAAVVTAASGLVGAGHLDSTTTFDILAWTVILWLVVRLLAGADRRLWIGVGLAAGIGLQNKDTVVLLGAALAVGLLLARRWDLVRSPWAWAALGIAVLIWLPNLAWQAANGWPQITMSQRIGSDDANQIMLLPLQILLGGSFLAPVFVGGLVWLLRSEAARPWRCLGWGYLVLLAVLFLSHGKGYYSAGYLPVLFGAGAIVTDRWLANGRLRLRRAVFIVAAAASLVFVVGVMLPIAPPSSAAASAIHGLYKESGEQVGWPELAAEVQAVADALPAGERSKAIVLTANYGEAGALTLLGGPSMPPVFSGHNSYWEWGPPPDLDGPVIAVGYDGWWLAAMFKVCGTAGTVDNHVGLANDEQGQPITLCSGRVAPWSVLWPSQRHLD